MAQLTPIESFQFRGVDSRSHPLNMPPGSALRCRNWVPKENGSMELRYGFSTVTMSTVSATAFHSLLPYTQYDNSGIETPYLILGQGTNFTVLNINTGVVTSPTIKGAALSSSNSFQSYLANGKIHFGNGVSQKWFDGTTVRDNGLRSLTAAEIANIVIGFGIGELDAAANSTITLTAAAGGTFPATTGNGFLFYVSLFDTTTNELGPATVKASTGRITVTANQKVTVANMPNNSATFPNVVKLISRTGDSLSSAYFCTNTSTTVTSCTRSSTTLTVISTAHGLSTGDVVVLSGTSNFDSLYKVTVSDANTFTVTLFQAVGQNITGANTTGGTCKRVVAAAAATTSVDVTAPTQDTTILANDAARGLAASSSTLANPGYQFYASIYNPNGGTHVGNRIAIGAGRFVSTTVRVNARITGLPDLSGTDSEWVVLIGRTGDSAQVPYPCADSNVNWFFAASGQTAITLTNQGALDGNNEMPTRNGVIPAGLNMFALSGGKIAGAISGRPTVYFSADESDSLNGDFVGRWEQSWAPTDIETFPTAQGLVGMFDEDRGVFCGTKNDGGIIADLGPVRAWIGPWYGAGFAGARSWCNTPYGKYWVTGHKQLATFEDGLPVAVSNEYSTALLSKIGDAYLTQVEMKHLADIAKGIDKIVIKCLDSTGTPFEVHHDFKLRDARSAIGQGYESVYSSPLATNFVMSKVRDANGVERLWAGASTGRLYQLETGANDAGTEFAADALYLLNGGPNRPTLPEIRWYGDAGVVVSGTRKLNTALADIPKWTPATGGAEIVQGSDGDSYFRAKPPAGMSTEASHMYIRFQLTSHSADGNLDSNDPPHNPLEVYGRIYLVQGLAGEQRGA